VPEQTLMLARVLTAAVLLPVVVLAVTWGPSWVVAALVALVTLLALHEFFRLGERVGLRGYHRWTTVCALALVLEQWATADVRTWPMGPDAKLVRTTGVLVLPLEFVFIVFALGAAVIALASRRGLRTSESGVLPAVGISASGLLFVALPLSYLVRLEGIEPRGPQLVLFALVLVWAGDTLAYFVGRAVGRFPMAPTLSPSKTWEGAVANVMGSLVAALLVARWLHVEPRQLLGVAVLANIAGQVGDLVESAYKRSAGVKDSGVLLPGHGGMLDRIDSLVFVAPVVWWYFGVVLQGRF